MGVSIQLKCLSVQYGNQKVLKELDLDVEPGSILAVVGLSGDGKTTLLKAISGQLKGSPAEITGQILLDGKPAADVFEGREISMCFQRPYLMPWQTAKDNITLNHRLHSTKQAKDFPAQLLKEFGLADAADKYPHEMSGGMQQRVALAREFARVPDLLLLDEPFANLDCVTREQLNDYLIAFAKRLRSTVVLVTHDPEEAVYAADQVVVLSGGRFADSPRSIVFANRTHEIRQNKEFRGHVEWLIQALSKNSKSDRR